MKDDNFSALWILKVIYRFIDHDKVAMLDAGYHAHAINLKAAYGCMEHEEDSQGSEDGDDDIANILCHSSYTIVFSV